MSSAAVCQWAYETEIHKWESHGDEEQIEDLELTAEVDRVTGLLEHQDDEELCDSVYSKGTLDRAVAFLIVQSIKLRETCGLPTPVPNIDLGPNGSIDLHWKRSNWELLVNVPADANRLAAFYGDNYGSQKIKGTFDLNNFNYGLAEWLMTK